MEPAGGISVQCLSVGRLECCGMGFSSSPVSSGEAGRWVLGTKRMVLRGATRGREVWFFGVERGRGAGWVRLLGGVDCGFRGERAY